MYGDYDRFYQSYVPGVVTADESRVAPTAYNNATRRENVEPHSGLAVTSALYRLGRTNTRATDPNGPMRIVQTGSQRTSGFEVGITGCVTSAWRFAGGYAYQDAYVTSASAARAATVDSC